MKSLLFELFNRTLGVIFRGVQKTLVDKWPDQGIHARVKLNAIQESVDYVLSNLSDAMIFYSRKDFWNYCVSRKSNLKNSGGIILEFGVWKGESINFFAKKCPKANLYGFDSFEGLEEDWHGFSYPKGTFSTSGELPRHEKNVTLYKGWFEDTLPDFINRLGSLQIDILHMDADTYKLTAYVLGKIKENISKGTIVIFDEYFGYPNFKSHEFKAWQEFVISNGVKYHYIAYTETRVAIEIT